MDRSELYMLDVYKKHELIKRLKPIVNWEEIKCGTVIWNDSSNCVFGYDIFEGLNPTDEDIIIYRNREDKQYTFSKTGWYYYDENIADEVDEMWTPKLYILDYFEGENSCEYVIACNEDHLLSVWNAKNNETYTLDEFQEIFNITQLTKCGDFDIVVK